MDTAINLHAHRPWYWGEPQKEEIRTVDTPEEIRKCLSCTHGRCVNCLDRMKTFTDERYLLAAPFVFHEMSRTQLAKEIGVHETTITSWARKYRNIMGATK